MYRWTLLGLIASHSVFAQEVQTPEAPLETITVTANPLGSQQFELVNPVFQISEERLDKQSNGSLGEALRGTPGVSSSYFGPNASRPIIRGQDGDRIRIMQNGIGSLDASQLSPDHATAVDPFILQGIEIVRGPAALLYGGSAIGGLVNTIDNRIPSSRIDNGSKAKGVLRFGGPDRQKSGAAIVEYGNEHFAVHADAYKRESENIQIPGYARSKRLRELSPLEEGEEVRDTLSNSSAENQGGALGATLFLGKAYVGASYSGFKSEYGVVAEEDVRIQMKSGRWDLASEIYDPALGIEKIKFRLGVADYEHKELEGAEVGTTFDNQGYEASIEATHVQLGIFKGALGIQTQDTKFSALGEEAFLPKVDSDSLAAFLFEEASLGQLKLTLGARTEYVAHHADPVEGVDRFTNETRNFHPSSYSLGGLYSIGRGWGISLNAAATQRAPTYNELFADGPHAATGQYEIGDRGLNVEKSQQVELGARFKNGADFANLNVFFNRFEDYITLSDTGEIVGEEDEALPEARITAVPADFHGFEFEGNTRLISGVYLFDLGLTGDYLWAKNRDSGDALPRIAPYHITLSPSLSLGAASLDLDVTYTGPQKRVAENELRTDAYTLLDLTLSYDFIPSETSYADLQVFVKGNNLLDEEARVHTSVLKDIAPLPGRAILVGLKGTI